MARSANGLSLSNIGFGSRFWPYKNLIEFKDSTASTPATWQCSPRVRLRAGNKPTALMLSGEGAMTDRPQWWKAAGVNSHPLCGGVQSLF